MLCSPAVRMSPCCLPQCPPYLFHQLTPPSPPTPSPLAAGVLGMPSGPFLYADEFLATIKARHAAKGYKEVVMYIEACESGSMFEGLLPEDLDVYVTTAANAFESSWATYCPTYASVSAAGCVLVVYSSVCVVAVRLLYATEYHVAS